MARIYIQRAMQNVLDPSNWRDALREPAYPSHLLQIVDSDEILAAGAGFFAAEGLRQGQAVILTGTKPHLAGIRGVIRTLGIDPDAAERNQQLFVGDAMEAVQAVMVNNLPDRARFEAIASGAIELARRDPRYRGVRWWGEMTTTLIERGERDAGLAAERLADALAKTCNATVFCSYPCDRYDARGYGEELVELCCIHSHVIPAEDYVRHRLAVNRAIAEVVGELKGSVLQSLASWRGLSCSLPSSQALLFWLRDAMPERFEAVLERARRHAQGPPL